MFASSSQSLEQSEEDGKELEAIFREVEAEFEDPKGVKAKQAQKEVLDEAQKVSSILDNLTKTSAAKNTTKKQTTAPKADP